MPAESGLEGRRRAVSTRWRCALAVLFLAQAAAGPAFGAWSAKSLGTVVDGAAGGFFFGLVRNEWDLGGGMSEARLHEETLADFTVRRQSTVARINLGMQINAGAQFGNHFIQFGGPLALVEVVVTISDLVIEGTSFAVSARADAATHQDADADAAAAGPAPALAQVAVEAAAGPATGIPGRVISHDNLIAIGWRTFVSRNDGPFVPLFDGGFELDANRAVTAIGDIDLADITAIADPANPDVVTYLVARTLAFDFPLQNALEKFTFRNVSDLRVRTVRVVPEPGALVLAGVAVVLAMSFARSSRREARGSSAAPNEGPGRRRTPHPGTLRKRDAGNADGV